MHMWETGGHKEKEVEVFINILLTRLHTPAHVSLEFSNNCVPLGIQLSLHSHSVVCPFKTRAGDSIPVVLSPQSFPFCSGFLNCSSVSFFIFFLNEPFVFLQTLTDTDTKNIRKVKKL